MRARQRWSKNNALGELCRGEIFDGNDNFINVYDEEDDADCDDVDDEDGDDVDDDDQADDDYNISERFFLDFDKLYRRN